MFIIGSGKKSYGVCVTFYEKLRPKFEDDLEKMHLEWKSNSIVSFFNT